MADRKISDLTALTAPASGDFLPIVDISEAAAATKNKRITIEELMRGMPDGTAAAPGIAFENDPNTGIYSPGADQVAISTNGTERLRITSAGVGIGIAIPNSNCRLHSNGQIYINSDTEYLRFVNAADSVYQAKISNSSSNLQIVNRQAGSLEFHTSDTERARIDSSGRVGIGTSSVTGANTRLEVSNDSAEIKVSSTVNANFRGIRFGITGDSTAYSGIRFEPNAGELRTESGFSGWGGFQTFYTNGVERLRITPTGLVGIGTTSPQNTFVVSNAGAEGLEIVPTGGSPNVIAFNRSTAAYAPLTLNGSEQIFQASGTERARIDSSGRLLVGTSTAVDQGLVLISYSGGVNQGAIFADTNATSGNNAIRFKVAGATVGSITTTSSATAYNTSSDYRLKENVTAVTDGITRLQQLKPSRFNFIANPDHTVDGFIAHDVQTVVPEAITGEKDAVDDDGNPVYQGIDQSKLVPLLTAALQEAIAKIETLEAKVAALEAA